MKEEYSFHVRDIIVGDPYILADSVTKKYYVYSRQFRSERFPYQKEKGCFYAICSKDLIHWSKPEKVFEKGSFWADMDYWAPECHIWKGAYYLVSSFRVEGSYRGCQFLRADNPLGPFVPVGKGPVTPESWHCLDGTLYIDRKGRPWIVFCHEWLQVFDGQIAAVPLSDDLSRAIGEPTILFRASDAPWAAHLSGKDDYNGNVTDGPFLHRLPDGTLVMLWSNFCRKGYATGYAVSRSGEINGPWIQEEEPLYALDGAHSMLFYTFEGQLMMALHSPNDVNSRRMLLFEMDESDGKLRILNEVTGNWYDRVGGIGRPFRSKTPLLGGM